MLYLDTDGSHKGFVKLSNTTVDGLELDASDEFGHSIANLGDWDGDGVQDIAVGTPFDDDTSSNKGAIWMIQIQ